MYIIMSEVASFVYNNKRDERRVMPNEYVHKDQNKI